MQRATRYWITDRRVLIAQGDEELHLERTRIIDVIDAPAAGGDRAISDLFLILDGPRARAVAMQGAFDDQAPRELSPILRNVLDGEEVGRILRAKAMGA